MSDERPPFLLRHKWLISLMIFLVLFVPADWITGYVVYHSKDYHPAQDGPGRTAPGGDTTRVYSPYYHHGLAPMATKTDQWGPDGYTLNTNSLGFKDRARREVPLDSENYRLLILGDSFTEAVGITYEDTWAGLVEEQLAVENVEVLNAGVVSYSPKLYYYKALYLIEEVGLKFDELMVFVDMSDVPDELLYNGFVPENVRPDDAWTGRFEQSPSPLGFWDHSLVVRSIKRNLGHDPWRATRFTDPETGESIDFTDKRDEWAYNPWLQRRWGHVGIASCEYYMERLQQLCDEHGIRLTLGIYPWPEAIASGQRDDLYRRTWVEFAQTHGLELIDLYDTMIPEDAAARQALTETVFIPGDVHYNREGQKLWAQAVLDYWHNSPARSKDASPAQPE
jgi:lysophospholipase L1-like esterase